MDSCDSTGRTTIYGGFKNQYLAQLAMEFT